jgi:Na+-transporting NADH:ubiquinone oxidoreductase subunit NqrF
MGRVKWEATLRRRRSCCRWLGVKLAEVLVEEMVAVLAACGGGRKKKKQKKKICRGEREDLAMAAPVAGEDLGSWGG